MRQRTQQVLENFMGPPRSAGNTNTRRRPRRPVISYWGYGSPYDFDDQTQDNSPQNMWYNNTTQFIQSEVW